MVVKGQAGRLSYNNTCDESHRYISDPERAALQREGIRLRQDYGGRSVTPPLHKNIIRMRLPCPPEADSQ